MAENSEQATIESAQVQMLKDILTARCGNDVDAAEGEDANACAELCEGDAFAGEGADERADARNDARGSCVDQATTLVYEVHAPEDADLAAGQDEIVNNEGSAAEAVHETEELPPAEVPVDGDGRKDPCDAVPADPDTPIDDTCVEEARQQIQETASRACTRMMAETMARRNLRRRCRRPTLSRPTTASLIMSCLPSRQVPAISFARVRNTTLQAAEPADRCKSDHELLAQQALAISFCKGATATTLQAYAEPADHCKSAQQALAISFCKGATATTLQAYDEPADNCKSAQQAYDEPADNCKSDHDAHPASDAQQAHMEPSDHCKFDELPAHGQAYNEPTKHCESELLGQDLNLASSAPFRACEADHAPLVDPKFRPLYTCMLSSLTIANIEPAKNQDLLQAQIQSRAKAKAQPGRGRGGGRGRPMKRPVCFASAKSIHRVTLQEVIRVCTKVAIALDKGDDLQAVLRDFFQDRVTLRRLHEEREHNPELTFTELSVPDVD
ncbi:unnamed protein product [Effrenium voratum]|uniref:Uncharacterized protein n=1 Tax=Effrenium voratum TaxID=2562239 RepID=A0AA36JGK8_9DINO|nr:unnamed protein product [Effrenium voratum]